MCGILGLFPGTSGDAHKALRAIAHRGRDGSRVEKVTDGVFGHVLHSVVGDVQQPLCGRGVLVFNGELYNWRSVCEELGISVANDAECLLYVLDHDVGLPREIFTGVYAFAYLRDGVLLVERDQLGVKPLFYVHDEQGFGFASEAKALRVLGRTPRELHPRSTLRYHVESDSLDVSVRPFSFSVLDVPLPEVLREAVLRRVPDSNRVGLLFSGGVDSSLLAKILLDAGVDVTGYVAALDDPEKSEPVDLLQARSAAEALGLRLVEVRAGLEDVEGLLPVVSRAIEDSGVVKVGVALPFWLCCERASTDGFRVVFSGLGAEEVFAGYERHKQAVDVGAECLRGLRRLHERDLYRDDVVGMMHALEVRLPFLDSSVVGAGLAIPGEDKIVDGLGKMPLRHAAMFLGVPEDIALRPKKAAQYGSQFDAALAKLARREGLTKSAYLRRFYPSNGRLVCLLSGGKDSVYALYTMLRMNYDVACVACVLSDNPHSYMFHTPLTDRVSEQAESMGLPLLSVRTAGVKEEELGALRTLLLRAVDEYGVTGVVSGALFSDYQRRRIEGLCEELGLQCFAPLWHLNQEQLVREVLDAGFRFVMSRVAADGLDRSWVGREITHEDVDLLRDMLGLNVAGEGGEYETFVVDGPLFTKRLSLEGFGVFCERDGSSGDVCELGLRGSR